MSTKNMAYDQSTYITRQSEGMGEAGGAATTGYAKFAAFTAMQVFSAQLTVTVAGTNAAHAFVINRISGTATTALGTGTLGTAAAGTTINVPLSAVVGGVALLQGDIVQANSGVDATGKAAVGLEVAVTPLANVTT